MCNKSTKEQICSKCKKKLPLTEEFFTKNTSSNFPNTAGEFYFRPECRLCEKKVVNERYKARKLAGNPDIPQLGTPCGNCGRTDRHLVFDHDHKTLKHRGWLCNSCNRAIGMLGDDVESMERVILYLKGLK